MVTVSLAWTTGEALLHDMSIWPIVRAAAAPKKTCILSHRHAPSARTKPHHLTLVACDVGRRRRRSASINGELANDALAYSDQPGAPWPGMQPGGPKGLAMAHQVLMAAQQQRLAQHAAALASMGAGYGMPPMPGMGLPPPSGRSSLDAPVGPALAGMYGRPPPGPGYYGPDAGARDRKLQSLSFLS
jgi:hypothetical protein